MSETLSRARPQIDDPQAIDAVIRGIVETAGPIAVYLYGSRARGEARADSDYDLMVVVPDDSPRGRLESYVSRRGAGGRRIGVDVRVSRESAFARRRRAVGTLEHEVELEGVELYRSPQAGGEANVTEPDVPDPGEVVQEWLGSLDRDLAAGRACSQAEIPDRAVYLLQQAAEKLTKAALIAHEIRPRKGHRIGEFARRLPRSFPLRDRYIALDRFTKYAWIFRYPDETGAPPEPVPSTSQVEDWLAEVAALKADFERWLEARGGEASP